MESALQSWYKSSMTAKQSGWVVYERQEDQFVFLSKPLKTKQQAEKERLRLTQRPGYRRRSAIGIGFVKIPE